MSLSSGHLNWRVARAAEILRAGGIVVHATEAVYGLAACATNFAACQRISELKSRRADQNFIVLCQSLRQVARFASVDTAMHEEILASWPGPCTWILPAVDSTPFWLINDHGEIAVRVTAHKQASDLAFAAGPLISTSANLAGKAPAMRLFAARRYFGAAVDDYLPGNLGTSLRPTKIINGTTGVLIRA